MIFSMTGYGRVEETLHNRTITVELRSVNNRYLDCTVKLPRLYFFAEESVKARVQKYISRGKVDVYISVDQRGTEDISVSLNRPLAEGYLAAMRAMGKTFGLQDDITISALSRFPDVFIMEKEQPDTELLTADICKVLDLALESHAFMRRREGNRLVEDIKARLSELSALADKVELRSPLTVAEYRTRMEQKMREVLDHMDIEESRILTEVALFADKVAVNEEVVRLRSHLDQAADLLEADGPVGRKLDFLLQELNREANTIGSKGNDVEMARLVVDMKAELEKVREQVQNIE